MKAASSATALVHAYGAAFDNPELDRRLRRRRRRGRDRPARRQLAFEQVPEPCHATAPCCRSCISTATRSPTPRCSPASATMICAISSSGIWLRALLRRRDTSRPSMHSKMAAAFDAVFDQHQRDIQAKARRQAAPSMPRVADDRAAQPERLDGAQGSRRQEGRGLLARPSGAGLQLPRRTTATAKILEDWMRSYEPGKLVRCATDA